MEILKEVHAPPLDAGRARALSIDEDSVHHDYEFGGPVGVTAMMVVFPLLFWHLAYCLVLNDGVIALPTPTTFAAIADHAWPTQHTTIVYYGFLSIQLLLAFYAPGIITPGLPLRANGGKPLPYSCNALAAFYLYLVGVLAAQYTGVFDFSQLIDDFPRYLTLSIWSGFGFAVITYIDGLRANGGYRMSGNVIYDYFMGSRLNPRVRLPAFMQGKEIDIKMFFEIRISWITLFTITMAACFKQYKEEGAVSGNLALFTLGTGIYTNSCAKGEALIPQTWDMNFEKFGWLLSYWNISGVPFSYAYPAIWMGSRPSSTYAYPLWVNAVLATILVVSYSIFDCTMAQKSNFKADTSGHPLPERPWAYPKIPGSRILNPKWIETPKGQKLLIDGWWGWVRKPNYTFDQVQAWVWALSAGFGTPITFWYPVFHLGMLLHRNARDDERCARKYKETWVEYKKRVPYSYIPGVW